MSERPKKKRSAVWILFAIVLPIACLLIGIAIAAVIGVSAFLGYADRSKTAEASSNLRALYAGAASYYAQTDHCTVGPSTTANVPGPDRSRVDYVSDEFQALGFSATDYHYFQYEIVSSGSSCGHPAGSVLYTFVAHGDLDGDGTRSRFEISVGSDSNNELFRSPGVYIENELE
jgi:hypothetical protein